MKRIFLLMLLALIVVGCGDDWALGDSSGQYRFSARYHFYYGTVCDYDTGPYNCDEVSSISPSLTVSLKIEYDGYATLRLDGDTYFFDEMEYSQGVDQGRYYYQFYDGYDEITFYEDGYEVIYVDYWEGKAYYYYDELY